jgi:hypothetical protein
MDIDDPHSDRDEFDQGPDRRPQPDGADRPGDKIKPRDAAETRSRQECRDDLVSASSPEGGTPPWMPAKPAVERSEWQVPLDEGAVDRVGPGVIDERAKKFSPAERRIAEHLAANGVAVVSVSEG